ncbi:DUF2515 domain-containing protein [Paenibacillus sp. H1-7]|uniref:DUF2515 domain-containing protein n=1 Tax=Paenibacillus sp. H1-7 TaxID=2282849 RepID=UPI001EF8F0A4|nr:DUF2515 domain-containing protein [Paenibacillus sp. H1-7]ULL18215.1 DUF2515 domain-containing protein [Paenibacillus sp. H1-7]
MQRGKYRWGVSDLLHKLASVPQEIIHWAKDKTDTFLYEKDQLEHIQVIQIRDEEVGILQAQLRGLLDPAMSVKGKSLSDASSAAESLSAADQELVRHIRLETARRNRSNITRTAAYLDMFTRHPELHWSFLAHMVSRNGGWNMTDLKGELLPYLLSTIQQEHVYAFLERANALIFHDAYPQLLLYEASLRAGKPKFHCLRGLNVSSFMLPVWELFWERRDSALLTMALIVNEQHYIEHRVVRHPTYRTTVLDTLFFNAQSKLQLNQVVFPYYVDGRLRLAGLILESFSDLQERIELGKKLYAILFGIPVVLEGAVRYAAAQRHTGSRSDYFPHLFAPIRQAPPVPRGQLKEWLDGCSLRPGAAPLYSPRLTDVWKDRPVDEIEPEDWLSAETIDASLRYLASVEPPFSFDMTHEYCFGLNKIELAVLAGDLWS